MLLATATLFEPVAAHTAGDPLVVAPDASCAVVVERMVASRSSVAYVVDSGRRPIGIVTTGDVARRAAHQPAATPVRAMMTAPVVSVRSDEPLYRALVRMRRDRWRRLPVVDGDGALIGTVELEAALGPSLALLDRMTGDDSVAGLARIKAAQAGLAASLLDDEHPVSEIQALFSGFNLDLHRRVAALALEAMAGDGWGPPPVAFSLIVMGSIGRGESLLGPDQDNGFILDDHPDADRAVVAHFFEELAARVTGALAQVGFPPCRGKVMATSPTWRRSRSGWIEQVEGWIAQRSPESILHADICFDVRTACGPEALARSLRTRTQAALAARPVFLRDMALALFDQRVALGLFGSLVSDADDRGPHLDLKLRGLLPLVGAVRLLALRHGLADTSTLARVAALHARGVLSDEDRDLVGEAYRELAVLVLRQQLADHAAGRPLSGRVPTATWTRARRSRVADHLRAVDALQRRVREDLTGQVL